MPLTLNTGKKVSAWEHGKGVSDEVDTENIKTLFPSSNGYGGTLFLS